MTENKRVVPFAQDIYLSKGEAVFRVSLKDLSRNLPFITEILTYGGLNPEVLPFLHRLGMDTEHSMALSVSLYRDSATNRPAVLSVVVGKERTDNEWAGGNKSSLQATIGRNDDPWLRSELYQLAGLDMSAVEDLGSIEEPDRSKMESTVLRYMDEDEEHNVVQRINHLRNEIKVLYNIDCMI
jgi:hypothetical protein